MATSASATARIQPKKQTLDDAYAPPANFLEIDLVNAETHGIGNRRYTDYELKMRVSICAVGLQKYCGLTFLNLSLIHI